MASSDSSGVVSLKLLIDSKNRKVLFAEAGKDFVDFLFTLLSLPAGTIIRLLSKSTGMVGSIGNIYKSVQKLDDTYILPYVNKKSPLIPKSLVTGPNILKLNNDVNNVNSSRKTLYMCSKSNSSHFYDGGEGTHRYITEDPEEKCPRCSKTMNVLATYVGQATSTVESSGAGADGYVEGVG